MKADTKGFTLVELLVVVAVLGIISSIAIANLLNALDKSKQKRTMADVRTIGAAVEAYATDNSNYPYSVVDWTQLKPIINPYYFKSPPDADAWGNTWDAASTASGSNYSVSSQGKDGVASARPGGATTDFNCDIVFSAGRFFQWPEGTQN